MLSKPTSWACKLLPMEKTEALRTLHLHIGRHKTGTTSFQHYLATNQDALEELEIGLFTTRISPFSESDLLPSWAHEIPLVFIRPEFDFILRIATSDHNLNEAIMLETIRQNLASNTQHLIASHEALSYVRERHELEVLKEMAEQCGRKVRIYLVIREHATWLESYRKNIASFAQTAPNNSSYHYLEKDSWLFDNAALIEVYEAVFGKGSVIVIDYEQSVVDNGDICGPLIESMGFGPGVSSLEPVSWQNVSN